MTAHPLDLPTESRLPSFEGATDWLNSPPLTVDDLRGRAVLVQFCTYTCINWLRTLPYVRAWAAKYADQGLVVIGVHTPEFSFERDLENVQLAAKEMTVEYPIAVDNDYAVWDAFANRYWPAQYVADAHGRIRHHWFGEGDYERSEAVVQQLLREAGAGDVPSDLVSVDARGIEAAADWDSLRSPENYLGYGRTANFASPGGAVVDAPHGYALPQRLRSDHWALAGEWTITPEATVSNTAGGRIAYRFTARDLHLVMAPAIRRTPSPFRVLLDGRPPGPDHGVDVDDGGRGVLVDERLHQLVRGRGPVTERTFEIEFVDPGARAYAFTFG